MCSRPSTTDNRFTALLSRPEIPTQKGASTVRSLPNIDLVHGAFADGSDPGERRSTFATPRSRRSNEPDHRGVRRDTSPVVGGRDARPLRPKPPVALAPRINAPSLDPQMANKASPEQH